MIVMTDDCTRTMLPMPHTLVSRLLRLLTPALLLVSTPIAAQQKAMTIVDLINVPNVGSLQLSPDGSLLVYTRSEADWEQNKTVTHLWRARADGSRAMQLTTGEDGESSPRWSPDGSRVAFIAKRAGDEQAQVYLISNAGGEGQRLTEHATNVSSLSWSPDGDWIFFLAADENSAEQKAREKAQDDVYAFDENFQQEHLWRVHVPSGQEERLSSGDFTVSSYRLAPDGAEIVQRRAPSPQLDEGPRTEIWITAPNGRGERRVTDNSMAENGAALSPDGRTVMFIANANAEFDFYYNDKIFVVPATGGTPELLLPDLPHEVVDAAWAADGKSIFFLANTGVRQNLFRAEMANRKVTQLTSGDQSVGDWTYHPRLNRHVFTVSTPTNAGDVWTLDSRRGRSARQITRLFDDLASRYRLPRTEAIQWKGEDGVTVEGLLFYPLDYREGERYPLVVQTHGGPAASDKFSWHSPSNYVPVLTAMGYMVLKPNYRGSTGYGDPFLRDMVGNYFNQAHTDVMAGVDHLIALGLVDGDHMVKMGWSAGGHMTNKLITYTDRFKAASSGAGAANWISMYSQSDTRVYRTPWFGGTPWQENAPLEQYLADSPLTEIYKVETPTLVLVGEQDRRVPMTQSVELYRALKANGVPTKLYVAPRQGHGWRELRHRLFKANVELDWFERWLWGREYVWEEAPVDAISEVATDDAGPQSGR